MRNLLYGVVFAFAVAGCGGNSLMVADPNLASSEPRIIEIAPAFKTESVAFDPDDPAIWVHPSEPARSLILGTDKGEDNEPGGLYAFDLTGKTVQAFTDIQRPNNVDVEYGLKMDGKSVDIAVLTERNQRRLRVFAIDRQTGRLSDVSGPNLEVFAGEPGETGAPMGVGLYRRTSDSAIFAIVGRKTGPAEGYLWQYRLKAEKGRVNAELVRKFGSFSGSKEIEAIVVDDEKGWVFYSDEKVGIRKYAADPDAPDAGTELALFATKGREGDHEGLAIYADGQAGWLISCDQMDENSRYFVYPRVGPEGSPHRHEPEVAILKGGADDTDGIEATSASLGSDYPKGILVVMNSKDRNFLVYDFSEIKARLTSK